MSFVRDDDVAGKLPSRGLVSWEPTALREVGTTVVLPDGLTTHLVNGRVTVPVDPTGATWCWRVTVYSDTGIVLVRHVAVPDVPSIEFTELQQVDPTTLLPTEDTVPAWTAITTTIQGYMDAAAGSSTSAASSAFLAAADAQAASESAASAASDSLLAQDAASTAVSSSDTAGTFAGDASASATAAAASATTALGARDAALAAETDAEAAAATATTKAGEASTSALNAAGSAATASTASVTAEDASVVATTAASSAEGSATAAAADALAADSSASTALSAAGLASASESAAALSAGEADDARVAAQAAQTGAELAETNAAASALTATTAAGEADASATAAAADALVVSTNLAAMVVDGDVVDNDLILTKQDLSTVNAGRVVGDTGIEASPTPPPNTEVLWLDESEDHDLIQFGTEGATPGDLVTLSPEGEPTWTDPLAAVSAHVAAPTGTDDRLQVGGVDVTPEQVGAQTYLGLKRGNLRYLIEAAGGLWEASEMTIDTVADTITIPAHGWNNGDSVAFYPTTSNSLPGGTVAGKVLYVANATTDTFSLSTSSDGTSPVDLTSEGAVTGWKLGKISGSVRAIVGSFLVPNGKGIRVRGEMFCAVSDPGSFYIILGYNNSNGPMISAGPQRFTFDVVLEVVEWQGSYAVRAQGFSAQHSTAYTYSYQAVAGFHYGSNLYLYPSRGIYSLSMQSGGLSTSVIAGSWMEVYEL